MICLDVRLLGHSEASVVLWHVSVEMPWTLSRLKRVILLCITSTALPSLSNCNVVRSLGLVPLRARKATANTWFWNSRRPSRSEEHTSELQSRGHLVCRLLLEKKKIASTIKRT